MAVSPVRRVLDRLPSAGTRRAQLSVAAYRTAFRADDDGDE